MSIHRYHVSSLPTEPNHHLLIGIQTNIICGAGVPEAVGVDWFVEGFSSEFSYDLVDAFVREWISIRCMPELRVRLLALWMLL